MASIEDYALPPPKNEDRFEDLVLDLYRRIWGDPDAQRVGSRGQAQGGVDVVGHPGRGAAVAGVQAKLRTGRLTVAELLEAIEKAKQFDPPLASFTIVTTARRDARLQQIAVAKIVEHRHAGLFSVAVLGWQEVEHRLHDYPDLVRKYYGNLFPPQSGTETPELRLMLRDEGERQVDGRPYRIVGLVLHNAGATAAVRYSFQLQLPFLPPTLTQPVGERCVLRPVVAGTPEGNGLRHWKPWKEGDDLWGVTFLSLGEIDVQPRSDLLLGQFFLVPSWFGPPHVPRRYACPFSLEGASTGPIRGTLHLDLFELVPGRY